MAEHFPNIKKDTSIQVQVQEIERTNCLKTKFYNSKKGVQLPIKETPLDY
jgi:hypothetical protein